MKKRFSHKRIMRDVEKELELLYKDLQREIDNSVSIIEDRMAALKNLVSVADKRILLAASEIEKREKAASFSFPHPEADNSGDIEKAAVEPLAIYTRRQIVEKAAEAAAHSAKSAAAAISPREQVVLLAKQDISPDEIATILSLPRSEVDLILALDL